MHAESADAAAHQSGGSPPAPDPDLAGLRLADLIDAGAVQSLMDDFYRVARIPMSIIDLEGRVLVGVGWQRICTSFHRVHPETCAHCLESDLELSAGLDPGEFRLYKCKNHMWDIATPILVGGRHVGNVFCGQFFFDDEPLDYELLRAQARQYGFDEEAYLAALEAVPRLSRETINTGISFFIKLANMLSEASYANLLLARASAEREALQAEVLAAERARAAVAERMRSEINHRMKNNLTLLSGVLEMQAMGEAPGSASEHAIRDAITRLTALSVVHEQLHEARSARVELQAVLRRIAELAGRALSAGLVSVTVTGATTSVSSKLGSTLALLANELITNALKYGKPANTGKLELEIALALPEGGLDLQIWNSGDPGPAGLDRRGGLGLTLVQEVVAHQLQGSFTLQEQRGGVLAHIALPAEALRGSEFVPVEEGRERPSV